jgi:hypothetical protein
MAESTTEQDMQSEDENAVVLEKHAGETLAEGGAGEAGTDTTETTANPATAAAPKRGRRARRAAAAARGEGADGSTGAVKADVKASKTSGDEASGSKAAGTKARSSRAGRKAAGATRPGADGAPILRRVVSGLLVVAVLLAAVLVVQLIKGAGNGGKLVVREDRAEDAQQQANLMLPKLYSYDYRQIDANVTEQLQLTTGTINDQIRTDTGPALKQLAPKVKAIVQAASVDTAVVDDTGPDIQVLVFLDQAVNSSLLPAPRLDRNRVVATMRLVNGQWKVADIKAL